LPGEAENPIFGHFSVMRAGIKTQSGLPKKTVFATAGWLNTGAGVAANRPAFSAFTTRFSV
jgi:hypothetical protein